MLRPDTTIRSNFLVPLFVAGVIPKMFANNTNSAGGTTNWDAHVVAITNTGFQIIMRGAAGTAFSAALQWMAFYPAV